MVDPPRSFKPNPVQRPPALIPNPPPAQPAATNHGFEPWGWLVLAGAGLLALNRIITLVRMLSDSNHMDGMDTLQLLMSETGVVALSLGLVLLGLLGQKLAVGARVAATVAGGYFLAIGSWSNLLSFVTRGL